MLNCNFDYLHMLSNNDFLSKINSYSNLKILTSILPNDEIHARTKLKCKVVVAHKVLKRNGLEFSKLLK